MEIIIILTSGQLLFVPIDSILADILTETTKAAQKCPEICRRIDADLDVLGQRSKARRQADARHVAEQTLPLPMACMMEIAAKHTVPDDKLQLEVGRPRTPAIVVLYFLALRGRYGSVSDQHSWERFTDSQTLACFLEPHVQRMPGRTTIIELLNAIRPETLSFILNWQLQQALAEGLDDFQQLTIDSTAVHANSAWPTDVQMVHGLIDRAWRLGQRLKDWGVPAFRHWSCPRWLTDMQSAKVAVLMSRRAKIKKRHALWKRFVAVADKLLTRLQLEFDHVAPAIAAAKLTPTLGEQLLRAWNLLNQDLCDADELLNYVAAKQVGGEDISREESERIFSLSDRSAAFILKGDRHPTFGYKMQFGRSGNGFISAASVPLGNASDSGQLIPIVAQHIERTKITPTLVIADDGYASKPHATRLKKKHGVGEVSITGSKGKRQLGDAWYEPIHVQARKDRSAVESLMSVGKSGFEFGQCHRRGIEAVRSELLEKAIAYNFWRLAHERRRQAQEAAVATQLKKAG